MTAVSRVDHLIVAAESLAQGITWCENTLFVTPAAGGEHPLMGTHNAVLRIDTPAFGRAYLEIIAVNPAAPEPRRKRWFDLDDPALRNAIRRQPRLVHFVAECLPALGGSLALDSLGIDRGPMLAAERETPHGSLKWRISVRDDGQRLFHGMLPTLIEWGDLHPVDSLPASGLSLLSVMASHPRPDDLYAAYKSIGLDQVGVQAGPHNLVVTLDTPLGLVTLQSGGL
ncbi:MAG: VOC family protein [Pseudomonadota bacterium]|nr:VOC family protein [Pseudomonadota bacterium]